MLLAIAEAVASGSDFADEQADVSGQAADRELSGSGAVGIDSERGCLFADDLVSIGVNQLELCRTADAMVSGVKQTGRNGGIVTLTDEARHVRLYHHIFLCDDLAIDVAIEHVNGVGNTHEAPCRQTLREGERQRDMAVAIRFQSRIAEGCLVEILAELYLLFYFFLLFYICCLFSS